MEPFSRTALLLGDEGMEKLKNARVAVFGLGGVGGYVVEALARSGIGALELVDHDTISLTNCNRQILATRETVGIDKAEAAANRARAINPDCEARAIKTFYLPETADQFDFTSYDYVVDAIDSLASKAALILHATACGVPLYSSMGAALKLDPTAIRVAEFWKVKGCPLARALRQRFKKQHTFPRHKFQCVFSEELLTNLGESHPEPVVGESSLVVTHGNGSLAHITAIYGFTLSGLILQHLQNCSKL